MALQDGEEFEMMSTDTTQVRIDGDAVKMLLDDLLALGKITEEQKEACFKEISFETIKTNRKDKSKKPKFIPPKFGPNTTPGGVVDMLGECREKAADLKKEEGMLKDWLKANITKPEKELVDKVQPIGINDDGTPAWALDSGSDT